MKLARELGFHGDVDAMLETLANDQYQRWVVLYTEEGFPEDRADWRNARAIVEAMYMAGKILKPDAQVQMRDFMPKFWVERDSTVESSRPKKYSKKEIAELKAKGKQLSEAVAHKLKGKNGT